MAISSFSAVLTSSRRRKEGALRALQESEERFRSTFDQVAVGVGHVASDGGHWLRVNDKLCEIVGYPREELLKKTLQEMTYPEDFDMDFEQASRLLSGDIDTHSVEKRYLREDGTIVWANLTSSMVRRPSGEREYCIVVLEDISKRNVDQEALGRSEQLFRASFEQAAVGMARVSLLSRWLKVNGRLCEILGYTEGELTRLGFQEVTHPDDLNADFNQFKRMLAEEIQTYSVVKRYIRKDGQEIWVNQTLSAVREPLGRLECFLCIVEDITEHKREEEALRRSEELYRTVVEQAAENIFVVDANSKRVLEANATLQHSLGYTEEEIKRLTLYDIVAHDGESIDANTERSLRNVRNSIGERCYRRKDGTFVEVEVNASTVPYGSGKAVCIVAHDITERKRMEERTRRSLNVMLALHQAGQVLGSTLEMEEIGTSLLRILHRVFDLTTTVISTRTEDGDLSVWRSVGFDDLWP